MTNPKRISVGPVGEHIALARWGEDGSGKPPALLLHGTGFVAEVWDEVARELASRYTVYALAPTWCPADIRSERPLDQRFAVHPGSALCLTIQDLSYDR